MFDVTKEPLIEFFKPGNLLVLNTRERSFVYLHEETSKDFQIVKKNKWAGFYEDEMTNKFYRKFFEYTYGAKPLLFLGYRLMKYTNGIHSTREVPCMFFLTKDKICCTNTVYSHLFKVAKNSSNL